MKNIFLITITLFYIIPLLSCKREVSTTDQNDNKSYLSDFELIQERPNNTKIEITSPKAILSSISQNLEIYNTNVKITNFQGISYDIISGKSFLHNANQTIRLFNDVIITGFEKDDSKITTSEFTWFLDKSLINLDNNLKINFNNTKIYSTNALFNLNNNLMHLYSVEFYREINNQNGRNNNLVTIIADNAKWQKQDGIIEFTSNQKQVETTIDFLAVK